MRQCRPLKRSSLIRATVCRSWVQIRLSSDNLFSAGSLESAGGQRPEREREGHVERGGVRGQQSQARVDRDEDSRLGFEPGRRVETSGKQNKALIQRIRWNSPNFWPFRLLYVTFLLNSWHCHCGRVR